MKTVGWIKEILGFLLRTDLVLRGSVPLSHREVTLNKLLNIYKLYLSHLPTGIQVRKSQLLLNHVIHMKTYGMNRRVQLEWRSALSYVTNMLRKFTG